jgi:response regulator RpfG family c-di-GMP phosphodiesterase
MIISEDDDFNRKVNSEISATFTTSVEIVKSLELAKSKIIEKKPNFIILDTRHASKLASELDHKIYDTPDTHLITIGKKLKLYSKSLQVQDLNELKKIVFYINKQFDPAETLSEEFFPINFDLVKHLQTSPTDLYIKLTTTHWAKYIKRFNRGETIEQNDVSRIEDRMSYLWIKSTDKNMYAKAIYESVQSQLNDKNPGTNFEKENIAFNYVRTFAKDLGVSPEVIELSERFVSLHVENNIQNDMLLAYLKKLTSQPLSYRFKLTQFTIAIASNICDFVKMQNQSDQIRKISFAALFHDLYIDSDEELLLRSDKQLNLKITETKKNLQIKYHAKKASELLMKHGTAPYDSLKIITEHHGNRYGTGFPEIIDNRLLGLSLIFIISEEFAMKLLSHTDPERHVPKALESIAKKYTNPNSAKYIKALKELSQFSLNFKPEG